MVEGALSPRIAGPAGRATTPAGRAGGRLTRDDAKRLAWRTLWAPFWVGSDVPAPEAPAREPARPADIGLAGEVVVKGLDQIRRRLWLRHALTVVVRAGWLGLAIGCLWLLVELAGGPALDVDRLVWVAAAVGVLGIGFAAMARPGRRQTARMLDRSFELQERLTTAVDHLGRGVPQPGQRAPVVYLQMADAANVIAELRHHRALGFRIPVRELVLTIFCGLLMAALFFLRGVGGDIPPVAAGAVPVFTPAVQRPPEPDPAAAAEAEQTELAPTVEEVRQRSERSNEAQRDLQALARALDDHAVTRSAAEAIGRGEYEAAANDLQDLAPSADRLSPGAREELARDLDEASSAMSPGGADLSQSAQEAASGLRQGGQAAQEGVRELGEAVERTGGEVASQQELADQMRRAEAAEAQGQQQGQSGAAPPGQEGSAAEAPMGEGQPGDGGRQPGQPGQEGAPQPGQGRPAPGEEGQGGQPGGQEGQPGDGEQGGQPGAEGQAGEGQSEGGGDGQRSEQGGGAGSGESQENGGEGDPGAAAEGGQQQSAQGVPAEERVTEGSGEGVAAGEPDPVTETIQLPPGTGGEGGVQTSNDGGGSRQGTGAGVTAGAGSAVQGEVGEAGPDSNRVPPAYRSVVERYFSDSAEDS